MAPKTRDKHDGDASGSSYFQKTVCLHDWWLVKADKEFEGRRLAIAGSTSIESKAFRLFTSAPIVKRNDVFTLQTADGICVCIKGFINKQRTLDNGFSSEVFNHFYFGFPTYWEKYAKECLGETSTGDIEDVPDSCNVARHSDPSLISTPSTHAVNSSTMVEEGSNLDSNQQKDKASTIKVQEEQNLDRNTPISLTSKLNHVKEYSPVKETRKKLDFEEVASPVSRERIGEESITSPEALNLKRSRSGRVPLPRNHAANSSSMVEERSNLGNRRKKDKVSTLKVQEEQNLDTNPSCLGSKLNHAKEYSPGKETAKELDLEEAASPISEERIGKQSITSPKSLNVKCSRSGRALLPRNHVVNSSSMVEERSNLNNSRQKDKTSTAKVQEKQNPDRNTPSSLASKLNHVKQCSPGKETQKKLDLEEAATPVSEERIGKQSILSPESLNLKRSRSGRVLLPRMEFWRNQIPVYDQDRRITGIMEEGVDDVNLSGTGSNSKSRSLLTLKGSLYKRYLIDKM